MLQKSLKRRSNVRIRAQYSCQYSWNITIDGVAGPVALADGGLDNRIEQRVLVAGERIGPRHLLVDAIVHDLPADQVLGVLVEEGCAERVVVADGLFEPDRVLQGLWRFQVGVKVDVSAGGPGPPRLVGPGTVPRGPPVGLEPRSIDRRRVPVAADVAVVVDPEGAADDGLVVAADVPGKADAGRDVVPGEGRVGAGDHFAGRSAVRVQAGEGREDALVVVVAEAQVEGEAFADPPRVVDEDAHRFLFVAVVVGQTPDLVVVRVVRSRSTRRYRSWCSNTRSQKLGPG